MQPELQALHRKHIKWLEDLKKKGKSPPKGLAAYVDTSVPNLSSIVALAEFVYIVMGVLQAWVGRGIGRSLLEALEGWAQSKGLHRLELMVNCNNGRAIRLYENFGFESEGVKRHALRIDGQYIDAFYMAKLIGG